MNPISQLQKYIQDVFSSDATFQPVYLDNSFPKYKIVQTSENEFILTLPLAGYDKKDISVKTAGNRLSVSYKKPEVKEVKEEKKEYPKVIMNQIAQREFDKVWLTNDKFTLDVNEVSFKDGLLEIKVIVKVPENLKEKEYTIK